MPDETNRPRFEFFNTSVTKGRPSRFCQADLRKLISPLRMSIISSLSDAM